MNTDAAAKTIVAMVRDWKIQRPDRQAIAAISTAAFGRDAFLNDYRARIRPMWLGESA